jgi:hypothetical protein
VAFARWCAANGRQPGPPTTEANLTSYIHHLTTEPNARTGRMTDPNTVRLAIAAIRHINGRHGYRDTPDQDAALLLYKDYQRAWREEGNGSRSEVTDSHGDTTTTTVVNAYAVG